MAYLYHAGPDPVRAHPRCVVFEERRRYAAAGASLRRPDGRRGERGGDADHHEGGDLDDDAERVAGQGIAEDDDPAGDRGHVGRGARAGDHRDGVAVLQPAGGGVEGGDRGGRSDQEPRGEEAGARRTGRRGR